jgi:hypothetical protein
MHPKRQTAPLLLQYLQCCQQQQQLLLLSLHRHAQA